MLYIHTFIKKKLLSSAHTYLLLAVKHFNTGILEMYYNNIFIKPIPASASIANRTQAFFSAVDQILRHHKLLSNKDLL